MASDAAYVDRVSAEVAEGLTRRLAALRDEGGDPASLGTPDEVAAKMLATVPDRSPWDRLGPFYSSKGIAATLGGISRQAVEERRRRRTILALRTADGEWVYPAFQLDDRNRVLRGLGDVLACFDGDEVDDWLLAGTLVAQTPELGGRSAIDVLRHDGTTPALLALMRDLASRWRR